MLQNYNFYRVLSLFLENSTKDFGWKEISNKLKLGPPSTKKYIDELKGDGIIIEKKFGGRNLYRANRENRKFRFFMIFDTAMKLETCGLIEFLNKAYGYPTIILFGSYSRGEATEESDIDIAIITESDKEIDIGDYKNVLKREVHLFNFKNEEIKKMRKDNASLYDGLINGFVLSGRLDV